MKRRRALLLSIVIVLALCAACSAQSADRHQQQYIRNRKLIVALENLDTKTALALVKAGADPNTLQYTPPMPTLPQPPKTRLQSPLVPVDNIPTAFLMACGWRWEHAVEDTSVYVAVDEDLPLLRAMLAHGAKVHARQDAALYTAVCENRLETVTLLLQHGANVNKADKNGITPLMVTAQNDTPAVMHLLLSHGANPNLQDKMDGNTALHFVSSFRACTSLIPEFLRHGADLTIRNKKGLTSLQLAQQADRPDIVRLLKHGKKYKHGKK